MFSLSDELLTGCAGVVPASRRNLQKSAKFQIQTGLKHNQSGLKRLFDFYANEKIRGRRVREEAQH
jgi:hypothetical protein